MPRIIISQECKDALRKAATWPLDESSARPRTDGNWSIPLEQNTVNRLREQRLEGEALSDTILRIIATQKGAN